MLHARVDRWIQAAGGRGRRSDNLIAGLIPRAQGVSDLEMAQALAERDLAMEERARALAIAAIESEAEWVKQCGSMPTAAGSRVRWLREISTVAAYRDRWHVSAQGPIDDRSQVASAEQMRERGRARVVAERAAVIGRDPHVHRTDSVSIPQMKVGPDVDLVSSRNAAKFLAVRIEKPFLSGLIRDPPWPTGRPWGSRCADPGG